MTARQTEPSPACGPASSASECVPLYSVSEMHILNWLSQAGEHIAGRFWITGTPRPGREGQNATSLDDSAAQAFSELQVGWAAAEKASVPVMLHHNQHLLPLVKS